MSKHKINKPCYFVLECQNKRGFKGIEVHGPFDSESQAMEFIKEDGVASYDAELDKKIGRDLDWGSNYIITQEISTWRPIPVVKKSWYMDLIRVNQPA